MTGAEFLRTLWGDKPPGFIQLWSLDTRASNYLRSPHGADVIAAAHGRRDVYTAVATTLQDRGRKHRATASQALAIAGLWLDIDVDGGPDSKTGAVPSVQCADWLARAIAEPTLIVLSGYGLHAWYLFDEPWQFYTRDEQREAAVASAQWYALHRTECARRGWGLDRTHDLARLLRLPGTVNGKGGGAAPVKVVEHGGHRYTREALTALAAQAGPVEVEIPGVRAAHTPGAAVVARVMDTLPVRAEVLAYNSPEFAAALGRQGDPRWTPSEWDLSLASQAVAAGFTDQEIADVIAWHRHHHDPADRKAHRVSYITNTIRVARAKREQGAAYELLAAA